MLRIGEILLKQTTKTDSPDAYRNGWRKGGKGNVNRGNTKMSFNVKNVS